MYLIKKIVSVVICAGLFTAFFSCQAVQKPKDKEVVDSPEKIDQSIAGNTSSALEYALQNAGKIDDSIRLQFVSAVDSFYNTISYANNWSKKEKWLPLADSLYWFIQHSELCGLFPNDYHYQQLFFIRKKIETDSVSRTDAALWMRADLLLTDGFMHLVKDLKIGRILKDSTSEKNDGTLSTRFLVASLQKAEAIGSISAVLDSIQPSLQGYRELKKGIKSFLDSMNRRNYVYLFYPYKNKDIKDSLAFFQSLRQRLLQSNCIDTTIDLPDSILFQNAIKHYQKRKGLKPDGKVSASLIKTLNNTDVERFKRIALTLDQYKQLPDSMPQHYIWVNLPGYYLQVLDNDTIVLESKIICGKPATPTPLLTSFISDMITYPTWTVPNSIIVKQLLPKLKINSNYLNRLGLHLVNTKGETISAASVNWNKYKRGIPYKIMQGSGDDNALGIFKFNFKNKFSVYLHDTNQRYLFKKTTRAFSHGCVRVEQWMPLAFYIARQDSLNVKQGEILQYNTDSINLWIAKKMRKQMNVKTGISLYIRYFSCEGNNGKIKFYDDVYDYDKTIIEKYFTGKNLTFSYQ